MHINCLSPPKRGSAREIAPLVNTFLKIFLNQDQQDKSWADLLPQAQLSYNLTTHSAVGFPPIEIVLGYCPKIPSSFTTPPNNTTYLDHIKDLKKSLEQIQTMSAMNMLQNKFRQIYYYDKHANTRHFREGEACFLIKDVTDP